MRGTVVRGIGLIVLVASAGCSVFQSHQLRIDAAAGMYQSAVIDYRVDGGQLSEPLTVARIAGHQVTHQRMPSAPHPDCSVAHLIVRYPHPVGKKDVALAKLIVETRTPGNPVAAANKAVWEQWGDAIATSARDIVPGMKTNDDVYEVWSLDIAKVDLDRVIAGMVQNGYFVNPAKTSIGIELSAQVDKFEAVKNWTHEPELDILIERVRRQGQLLSYQHPLEVGGPTTAVAAANDGSQTILVAHNEEGPALLPAGPQNDTYQSPPEPATPAVPQYTPPVQQYTPPAAVQPSLPYTPPQIGPYAPPQGRVQPIRPTPRMQNNQRPTTTPGGQTQPRQPAAGPMRKGNNPAARGTYPPQNRRQQMPPAGNAAPPNANGRGANPADTTRSQSRIRWPWQRPNANGQSATPTAPNAMQPDPRRAMPGGYGRQPASPGNRGPVNYGRPGQSPQQGGYPGYPQAAAPADGSSGGYPSGMPQPPQITSRPSGY